MGLLERLRFCLALMRWAADWFAHGVEGRRGRVAALGREEFVQRVMDAIDLLGRDAPQAHVLVQRYLKTVVEWRWGAEWEEMLSSKQGRYWVFVGRDLGHGTVEELASFLAWAAFRASTFERKRPEASRGEEGVETAAHAFMREVRRQLKLEDALPETPSRTPGTWLH